MTDADIIGKDGASAPPEPAHFPHGPSAAHRWMRCPGSIAAEAAYPDVTTEPADEGTAAHWLLEQCLLDGNSAADEAIVHDHIVPAGEETGCERDWPITGEMKEAVQLAIEHIQGFAKKKGTKLWVEDRVRLDDELCLPVPVGGTCDSFLYLPRSKVLVVRDFKYGKGVVVEVKEKDGRLNEQLVLYALGALYRFRREFPDREVKWVDLGIIQPRAFHKKGPIRSYKASVQELLSWEPELDLAVDATLDPNAPRIPGEKQCSFCKAKKDCAERHAALGDAAQDEWAAVSQPEPSTVPVPAAEQAPELARNDRGELVVPSGRAGVEDVVLPNLVPPSAMTAYQLGVVRRALGKYKDWIKAFDEEVKKRLEHDIPVAGARLGQGPGKRPWNDEKAALERLRELAAEGVVEETTVIDQPTPKSVAQVEKAVGKRKFKELGLSDLHSYVAGGAVVVDEESDKPDYVKPDPGFTAEAGPNESSSAPEQLDGEDLL